MTPLDFKHGLSCGNYGVTLEYKSDDGHDRFKQLVTWNEVLNGCRDGLLVWERRNTFWNMSQLFCNRSSSDESLQRFLNQIYDELYGDRLQCSYLLVCYYKFLSALCLKISVNDQNILSSVK